MAEIILERRKSAAVVSVSNPLIILLIICLFQQNAAQVINRVPHFIPQTGDMSQFSLPEGTAVGTPVYHLKGIDPDNGKLRYSISGQYFSVDSLTGVVTLAKALDREEQATLEVIISITDEGIDDTEPNTVSLRRVIPVRDVNDNPPVFHNRPYIVNITEASTVGSEIEVTPNIIITDRDEGDNAKIQVHCSTKERGSDVEACSTFRVVTDMITPNKYQVRIFLLKPLDYESRSAYVLTLDASDVSQKALHAIGSVSVAIQDVQDQPPVFVNAPYSATVPENTVPNAKIMEIIAKDGDTANPRPVLLTLEGDIQRYFRLQPERSIGRATLVTTEVPVDRESDVVVQNGGVYNFFVKATELINNEVPSDFTVIPITIIVTDVDDHIPVFNRDVFDISIPENIENGSPIPELSIYVEDYDLGQNSKYDLHLRNIHNSENVFAISTDHGEGRTPISIKVKDSSKLDYDVDDEEKRLFSFDIVTSVNNIELTAARVNIKLLDVNDNAPVFLESQYKFNVLENAPIGFKIGDVQATDKDYGIFGEIEYSLSGFGSFLFKTDKVMGGLFVANALDYEIQKSYSLTILAKDGGGKSSSVSIFIEVLDTNDNAPVFEASEYSRTIRDGASSFEPQLVIRATDADGLTQGGGRIRYSLESDNSIAHRGEVFAIDEETGEITINDKVETMDTPRGQYELLVRATDYGNPPLHNETRVFIRVGVPGNQRPTFKGNYHHYKYTINQLELNDDYTFDLNPMNYKASIREDATPGQNITNVVAHDPDGMDELLTYHIVSGSKDNFVINEKTGLITVSNDANLDRDINPERYEIIVSAVDSGIPIPETATTTVFVTIQDVNDKPPKFNETESTTYISERANVNDLVTKMVAHDSDLSAKLKYSFTEPLKAFSKAGVQIKANHMYDYKKMFKINEDTGEILVNSTLDYNQASKVILTVKVTDINAEINKDKQFAILEHTIYIRPYADKNPQFTNAGWTSSNPTIHHKIKEEQPIGSTVLVLMAEDPTSGHVVSNFKVISSQTSLIQVNPLSGQVVLSNNLDYEALNNPNLTLTVQATSNDGSKHSIADVIVEVINLNDNPPVFDKELYKVSILESIKPSEPIVTVHANDSDAVITEKDKANGFSEVRYSLKGENSELLTIDNITGVIQVAPNKTLDRERQSVLRLEVEASDTPAGGSDQLKSVTTVLIDVLDVDDNTPEFDKSVYTAVVPENVPIGISVVKLTAIDPDEGLGGEIKYEFLDEGEAHGLFNIDVATGEVTTLSALTGRGRTDPYRLLVGAVDGGGHTGDASLSLYIGDVSANDGVPRFIRPAVGEMLSVSENATIGTAIFQVVASDPDDPTQPSGQLFYSIQQSNADAKIFNLESETGLLSTRQSLDRERKSFYTLVLVVTDRGTPPQQSSRIVTVRVEDVDDHKPHFARVLDDPPLVITTKEEVPVGTIIGTIEAIDEDIDENAAIDYIITAGNELELVNLKRTNDSKAIITSAARLDREAISRLLLTVKCFKFDTKPRIHKDYNRLDLSEIQVVIKILDIDDHLPVFESSNMTIGVRLNVAVDTVIATVKAADKDPEALPINYNIFNMSFTSPIRSKSFNNISDVIVLNNVTGDIKIMKNLIHFADGIFRLVVRANNSNETDRHSDLEVEVVVVRERDLLRLVLGGDGRGARARVAGIRERVSAALTTQRLKLQLHDAPRHDIYDNLGPCFQFRKMDTGEALSPNAMKATIRSLGAQFQDILQTYNVHNITLCGAGRAAPAPAQTALLALAAVLPLAAFVATIVLCCMHSSAKRRMRASIAREAPPRLYTEPLYST